MTASTRPPVSIRPRVFRLVGIALPCLVVLLLGLRAAIVASRYKKAGEWTTVSLDDTEHGRVIVKATDLSAAKTEPTKENANPLVATKASRGGDAGVTLPPRWVPSYPGMLLDARGEKREVSDRLTGIYSARTKDPPERLEEYFSSTLKADGFETTVASTSTDGNETSIVRGTKDNGMRKITVTATRETGWTNLLIRYEGQQ